MLVVVVVVVVVLRLPRGTPLAGTYLATSSAT
jgi:hypothetical protein